MWGRIRSAVALIRSGSPVTSFQSNPLPSPVQRGIASATLLAVAVTAARSEAEMSKIVSAWILGMIKRCPSLTGLISVKATVPPPKMVRLEITDAIIPMLAGR